MKEEALFSLRAATSADLPYLNAYAAAEGMDALPSEQDVTVAVNADDIPVGFLRLAFGAAPAAQGIAHVNPVVVCTSWRGWKVGQTLMEDALAHYGELRLVARGSSRGFYERLGFESCAWEVIDPACVDDCNGCLMREECQPQPMRRCMGSR